jgi:predicted RNA-binding Zn ribbon-like protein
MDWPATARYGLDAAPGSLALVQDFVNTIPAGSPRGADLLGEPAAARAWLDDVLATWSRLRGAPADVVVLEESDLARLRRLRSALIDLIRAGGLDHADPAGLPRDLSVTAVLRLDEAGIVRALPTGSGWRRVASMLAVEMFDAQARDTWRRLKACANTRCSAAYFDRSRNNSRVWHDVAVCGNLANLRAHRARKRAAGGQGA